MNSDLTVIASTLILIMPNSDLKIDLIIVSIGEYNQNSDSNDFSMHNKEEIGLRMLEYMTRF